MPARRDTNRPSGVDAPRPHPHDIIVKVGQGHTPDWMDRVPVTTGKYATFRTSHGDAVHCFLAPKIEVQGPSDTEPSYVVHHDIIMAAASMILDHQVQGPHDIIGIGLAATDFGRYDLDRTPQGECQGIILRSDMQRGLLGLTARAIKSAVPGIAVDFYRE